jgi:hypothetical protein
MPRLTARSLPCLAALVALWPLHAEAQGTAPGSPPPACELLSKAEAEATIGKTLKPLGPLEYGPTQCAYTPVGEAFARKRSAAVYSDDAAWALAAARKLVTKLGVR